ncbi:MAG: UDP-3-O-(3-hydroxymyristoyl)glucosamine N-acyltransferase [Bacteroidetes bacterium]|nr:UDP-3-O-(3-hydroxymyristoyl)glucosamine N-acyltransferase [Bacteroidota bacterium]
MKVNIKFTTGEIANIIKGNIIGSDSLVITNLGKIENGKEGEISFLSSTNYEKYMEDCYATCIIVPKGYVNVPKPNQAYIEAENPYLSMVTLLKYVVAASNKNNDYKIHRSVIIAQSSKIPNNVRIGARCVIGEKCVLGNNVILHPNVILYDNVMIGDDTEIHSNVVCYDDTQIGSRCIIHSGAVIGADGFGFVESYDGKYDKIPQIGNVIIGNDVEIGANTTIDCALLNSTIIESGVKIDNLVQIGHNCSIGEDTAIAAQVGIAGSSKIGKRNRLGGQVGIAGHIELGNDIIITAQSGVSKSLQDKGIYHGAPAKERLQAFKIEAYLRKLPEIAIDVEMLKKHLTKTP